MPVDQTDSRPSVVKVAIVRSAESISQSHRASVASLWFLQEMAIVVKLDGGSTTLSKRAYYPLPILWCAVTVGTAGFLARDVTNTIISKATPRRIMSKLKLFALVVTDGGLLRKANGQDDDKLERL